MILSLATALISSVGIWWRDFWYELLPPRMWLVDLAGDVWLPLWLLTTCMAFIRFPAPRKRIWWLLLPAPLPLLPVLQFLFVILTWGTHGFAP
jgi:hypothetical protein